MVAIYADGAGVDQMRAYAADPRIQGFTTNPSLMRAAGITNYRDFAKAVLDVVRGKPVSFEVLADDFYGMEKQAREIASWGPNVYVKLPITNTRGESITPLIGALGELNLNITAVMTEDQLLGISHRLLPHHIVSIFAGRIMDTGVEPPRFTGSGYKLLWASAREVYSVQQAAEYGYDIITLTPALLAKLDLHRKNLAQYSLETVQQFQKDAEGIVL